MGSDFVFEAFCRVNVLVADVSIFDEVAVSEII